MMTFPSKYVGAIAGLIFGWMVVQYGFKAFFIIVVGLLGWLVGKVLDGEADISQYIRRRDEEELE